MPKVTALTKTGCLRQHPTNQKVEGLNEPAFQRITTLNLQDNRFEPEQLTALFQALLTNPSLTAINLSNLGLSDAQLPMIRQLLTKQNCSLKKLSLRNNSLFCNDVKLLFQDLSKNVTVNDFSISNVDFINSEVVSSITELLQSNKTLQSLNYCSNDAIGGEDTRENSDALGAALAQNTTLTTLNLFNNNLSAAGLSYALQENKTLTSFSFFSSDNCDSIASALLSNATLTDLSFKGNFSEQGIGSLAQVLKGKTTLVSLKSIFQNRNVEQYRILATAFQGNSTLKRLETNAISDEVMETYIDALSTNTVLEECFLRKPRLRGFDDRGFDIIQGDMVPLASSLTNMILSNSTLKTLEAPFLIEADQPIIEALNRNSSLLKFSAMFWEHDHREQTQYHKMRNIFNRNQHNYFSRKDTLQQLCWRVIQKNHVEISGLPEPVISLGIQNERRRST